MKILVIHTSAGAGHQKAAEYIADGLKKSGGHEVTLADALDYTYPFFKKSYAGIYKFMITRIPWAWGFVFYLIDYPVLLPLVRFIRRLHNGLHAAKLHKFLIREKFDVVISAHFMPTEVSAHLKRTGRISSKIITVITDYDVHSIWLAQGVEAYCIASDWTKRKMEVLGVPASKVHVTGIPVSAKFTLPVDKAALKAKLGIRSDKFTVLIATGSFGIGPIEPILRTLTNVQSLVVCGHNRRLYERLSAQNIDLAKIYGLVDNMDELMAAADCMITKPGGLSITEALNRHLPLIFFNAIPGQETGNVNVLKQHGIGISGRLVEEIAGLIHEYESSPTVYKEAVEKTRALARPDAVAKIIELISPQG